MLEFFNFVHFKTINMKKKFFSGKDGMFRLFILVAIICGVGFAITVAICYKCTLIECVCAGVAMFFMVAMCSSVQLGPATESGYKIKEV